MCSSGTLFSEWRKSQNAENVVLTNGAPVTTTNSRYFYTTSARPARSISPSRVSPRMERGRTRTRTLVYTNGANVQNTNTGTLVMTVKWLRFIFVIIILAALVLVCYQSLKTEIMYIGHNLNTYQNVNIEHKC